MTDLDQHLSAIAGGDDRAFALWLAAAEPEVRKGLFSFATTVDTEAVLQEALLRAWQVAPRITPDGRPNSLLRMCVRIARNLAISETRKKKPNPVEQPEDIPHEFAPPDPLLRRVIAMCREKLPKQPALALTARLSSAGGLHDEALAEQVGMKKNTFLQNFSRARKLLAECLEKSGVNLSLELR